MHTSLLINNSDIQSMRGLIAHLAERSAVVDFEELIQLESVRANTWLWWNKESLVAFAYVDDFNNLYYEVDPDADTAQLEKEFIDWGVECIRRRNKQTGETNSLDICVESKHISRAAVLEACGFVRMSTRSLKYSRSMKEPIELFPLPPGFICRCASGEAEVEALVALHRAAFNTDNMTIDGRLAIMRSPTYAADLDLVVVAPNGDLAAFCVCNFERGDQKGMGSTEPIGTSPHYQGLGLGKAVLSIALNALREKGCKTVTLGTSSENAAMQHLAESVGFTLVDEKSWFSKSV